MVIERHTNTIEFRLNPKLVLTELAEAYKARLRLHVPDILTAESAERLAQCLEHEVPWGFAYLENEGVYHRAEQIAVMSDASRRELLKRIYAKATHEFQYAYECYPMLDAYLQRWGQVPALERFLEFVNSQHVLGFVRALTGRQDIIKGDAQATCYGPGHFLRFHTDDVHSEYRVAAYVFNLTREWDRDWGGYLQFYDEHGDIEQAFLPRFNALNVFTVPQRHSVSYVAPFAAGRRFAITGWFRYQ